jgi:hypothetical protein
VGPRASTIWYVDAPDPVSVLRARPAPDADAAHALVRQLHPETTAVPLPSSSLDLSAAPGEREVFVGTYPGVTVICSRHLARKRPSTIDGSWTRPLASEHTYLVCSEDGVPWGSFAHWERGELRRSFSATTSLIHENSGLPLVWERSYWAGEHPPPRSFDGFPDPLSLPFHPGEFSDAANLQWLGFGHASDDGELSAADLTVCGFTLYASGEEPPPPREPEIRGLRRWWRRIAG